jgi:hypothetical protein
MFAERSASARAMGLFLVAGLLILPGCAFSPRQELANPTPIHSATVPPGSDPSPVQASARQAADLVPARYYAAMAKANVAAAPQADIDLYVREGVSLVELYCERWFSRVAEAQRRAELTESNRNIISQLGTAAIGIGGLHPDVTAVYGALNTAIGGFNGNFTSGYLAAPNAENVKRLTMEAVRSRGALLRNAAGELYPRDFSRAYVELEALADQCTHAEVRRLTTKSVDQSGARADPQTGEAIVFSTATAAQGTVLRSRGESVLDRIKALKPGVALALVRMMPARNQPEVLELLKEGDKKDERFTSDAVAKKVLAAVFVLTAKSDAAVADWESRLNLLAD